MFDFNLPQRAVFALIAVLILGVIGLRAREQPSSVPVAFAASSGPALPLPQTPSGASARHGGASPMPPRSPDVVVHVAGAVLKPGVYTLKSGQRIVDAIHLAGGPTSRASLDEINMAARVMDGQQILVPRKGSPMSSRPAATTAGTGRASRSSSRSTPKIPPQMVAVNTASPEQLDTLPGVGPATAQKIIDYRTQNGPFQTVDDLLNVKGIGPKKLEKLRPYVIVP